MALERFKVSPLPNPPREYDAAYMRQFIRVLEIYFSQMESLTPNQASSYRAREFFGGIFTGDAVDMVVVDAEFLAATSGALNDTNTAALSTGYLNATNAVLGNAVAGNFMAGAVSANSFSGDGTNVSTPYGQFISEVAQTAASTTVAYPLDYETAVYPNGITLTNNSELNFETAGTYRVTYSIQFESTVATTEQVDIWFSKNGTNVPLSTRRYGVSSRKSGSAPSYLIATTSVLLEITAADYIEINWCTTDTGVSIQPYAAGTSPTRPTTPAAIVSVAFASATYPPVTLVQPVSASASALVGNPQVNPPRTV